MELSILNLFQKHKKRREIAQGIASKLDSYLYKGVNVDEMKWKNSLNIIQFVQMTDTTILDRRIQKRNVPVFDIMTVASKMGVYSSFDWPSINK